MASGTILASGISVLDFPREVRFSWRLREGVDGDCVMTFEREGMVSLFPLPMQTARDIAAALGVIVNIAALDDGDAFCVEDFEAALSQ